MMKNQSILNLFFFTCFLVLGNFISTRIYHSGFTHLSDVSRLITIKNTKSIQTLNNGQHIILLIGVDSIDAPRPQLESLWLVSYLPSDSTLHLLPIFPSRNGDVSDFEEKLYRSFDITGSSGDSLSENFKNILKENNFWWSGYILYDHTALMELSNNFSDENMYTQNTSIERAIQALSGVNDDPKKAFSAQLAIIQISCQKISGVSQINDWSPTFSLINGHILTDLKINQFMQEWEEKPSSPQNLHCKFPTMEMPGNGN
jgi:hypothetical protein